MNRMFHNILHSDTKNQLRIVYIIPKHLYYLKMFSLSTDSNL